MEKKLKLIEGLAKITHVLVLVLGVYCFDWKWLVLYQLIVIQVILICFLIKFKD
jgi:hypothetical protein